MDHQRHPPSLGPVPSLGCLCADTICAVIVHECESRGLEDPDREVLTALRQMSPAIASRSLANCAASNLVDEAMFGPELLEVRLPCADLGSSVAAFTAQCTSCTKLELLGFESIDQASWAAAVSSMPLMEEVVLGGASSCIVRGGFVGVLAAIPSLTSLDLKTTELEEGAAAALARSVGPQLRHLHMSYSDLTAKALGQLVQRTPDLVSLHLQESKSLEALPDLPDSLEQLELLGCSSIPIHDVERAVTRAIRTGKLTHLGLAEHAITDDILSQWTLEAEKPMDGVQASETGWKPTKAAASCVTPRASASDATTAAASCSSAMVLPETAVCGRLDGLAHLDMSWNDRASPAVIMGLVRFAPNLEKLCLRCTGTDSDVPFTDEDAASLVGGCARLQWLSLTRWDTVGNATAEALSALPSLTHLDLAWSLSLTDEGVATLLQSEKGGLQYLGLEGCKSITEDGITSLATHPGSHSLQELRLDWVNAAGAEQVGLLRKDLPGTTIVDYYGLAEEEE